MTKKNMINEKELNNVTGGFNPVVLIPYIPTIIDGVKKIFGKNDNKTTDTKPQPTTVTNGPTFTNNTNNGGFNTSGNTQSQIGNNNGNIAGNQTITC